MRTLDPEHVLFEYGSEQGIVFGSGDRRLLQQVSVRQAPVVSSANLSVCRKVCIQMGYPRSEELLPRYLSGEHRLFIDNYPECAGVSIFLMSSR